MRRFRVSSGRWYFWCYVFDTKAEMYSWYVRYRIEVNKCELNFKALVMPYERVRVMEDGSELRHGNIGTCLFYKDALGAGLVAHEMLHCALWHDRLINGNSGAVYGEAIGECEERLAYLLTDFTACFVRKAYKVGLY